MNPVRAENSTSTPPPETTTTENSGFSLKLETGVLANGGLITRDMGHEPYYADQTGTQLIYQNALSGWFPGIDAFVLLRPQNGPLRAGLNVGLDWPLGLSMHASEFLPSGVYVEQQTDCYDDFSSYVCDELVETEAPPGVVSMQGPNLDVTGLLGVQLGSAKRLGLYAKAGLRHTFFSAEAQDIFDMTGNSGDPFTAIKSANYALVGGRVDFVPFTFGKGALVLGAEGNWGKGTLTIDEPGIQDTTAYALDDQITYDVSLQAGVTFGRDTAPFKKWHMPSLPFLHRKAKEPDAEPVPEIDPTFDFMPSSVSDPVSAVPTMQDTMSPTPTPSPKPSTPIGSGVTLVSTQTQPPITSPSPAPFVATKTVTPVTPATRTISIPYTGTPQRIIVTGDWSGNPSLKVVSVANGVIVVDVSTYAARSNPGDYFPLLVNGETGFGFSNNSQPANNQRATSTRD